ncbi:MAG TPA: hypothetical protein VGB89_07940 [Bacteroidota bacterium]
MGRPKHIGLILALIAIALLGLQEVVHACPSCYGDPNAADVKGLNVAIFALLGVTGGVLGAFVTFFFHLRKRARLVNQRFSSMIN